MSLEQLIERWALFTMYTFSALISLCLLKTEFFRRRNQITSTNKSSPSLISKYESIFSLFALIAVPLYSISRSFSKITFLCYYSSSIAVIFLLICFVSFAFYKLARLYYTFSESKSHSNNGYPNILFSFMYFIGFIALFVGFGIIWFAFKDTPKARKECIISYDTFYVILAFALFGFFILYDLFIVFLYYYKVFQFNQYIKVNKIDINRDVILQRIRFILNKILFLTLMIMIICTFAGGMIAIWDLVQDYMILHVLSNLSFAIMILVCQYMVFLMLEHNLNNYLKMLSFIDKFDFCYCCCKKIIDNARPHIIEYNNKENALKIDVEGVDGEHTKFGKYAEDGDKSMPTNTTQMLSIDIPRINSHRLSSMTVTGLGSPNERESFV